MTNKELIIKKCELELKAVDLQARIKILEQLLKEAKKEKQEQTNSVDPRQLKLID